jgi:polysaccharide export outer membrane protein
MRHRFFAWPLIGDVQAAGLTADALAQRISDRLKQYIASTPAVSVNVKDLNSYTVYVLEEVTKPGKFQLKSYGGRAGLVISRT